MCERFWPGQRMALISILQTDISLSQVILPRHFRFPTLNFKVSWSFCLRDVHESLRGVYMRKLAPVRVSYRDDFLISHRVYIMTGSFHISLFEGTLQDDSKSQHYACATRSSLPGDRFHTETKRVVFSRLHDTVARFRTGVTFSPRYNNRGELTPGWLAPAWHFVVVSCKQI